MKKDAKELSEQFKAILESIKCNNVAVLRERCPRVERYYYRRGTSAA